MTRLEAAVAELVAALREELATDAPTPAPRTYTVDEAAKIAGIGRTFAYREVDAGHLRATRRGRRLLVSERALAAYIEGER